jgi:hypothetical protein
LVESQEDFALLESKVFQAFGELDGPDMLLGVELASEPALPNEPRRRSAPREWGE